MGDGCETGYFDSRDDDDDDDDDDGGTRASAAATRARTARRRTDVGFPPYRDPGLEPGHPARVLHRAESRRATTTDGARGTGDWMSRTVETT